MSARRSLQLYLITLRLISGVIFSARSATQSKCAYKNVIISRNMAMLSKAVKSCWEKVVIDSYAFSPATRVPIKHCPLFPALFCRVDRLHLGQDGYIRHS